jgi:hypothetical protein
LAIGAVVVAGVAAVANQACNEIKCGQPRQRAEVGLKTVAPENHRRIVVVGNNGSGKSRLGNYVLSGAKAEPKFNESTLTHSCTQLVECWPVQSQFVPERVSNMGLRFHVADSPGQNDKDFDSQARHILELYTFLEKHPVACVVICLDCLRLDEANEEMLKFNRKLFQALGTAIIVALTSPRGASEQSSDRKGTVARSLNIPENELNLHFINTPGYNSDEKESGREEADMLRSMIFQIAAEAKPTRLHVFPFPHILESCRMDPIRGKFTRQAQIAAIRSRKETLCHLNSRPESIQRNGAAVTFLNSLSNRIDQLRSDLKLAENRRDELLAPVCPLFEPPLNPQVSRKWFWDDKQYVEVKLHHKFLNIPPAQIRVLSQFTYNCDWSGDAQVIIRQESDGTRYPVYRRLAKPHFWCWRSLQQHETANGSPRMCPQSELPDIAQHYWYAELKIEFDDYTVDAKAKDDAKKATSKLQVCIDETTRTLQILETDLQQVSVSAPDHDEQKLSLSDCHEQLRMLERSHWQLCELKRFYHDLTANYDREEEAPMDV